MLGVIFALTTSVAVLPPCPPDRRLLPHRRALSMTLKDEDYNVVSNDTIVDAVTDGNRLAGDAAPAWALEVRNDLARELGKLMVESGYDHPEESRVSRTLEIYGADGAMVFSSIILSDASWRGDLLRLLARVPAHLTEPWGVSLAAAALSDADVDVREAAITALEAWGGTDARSTLEAHTDPEDWLTEYARRVAAELAEL